MEQDTNAEIAAALVGCEADEIIAVGSRDGGLAVVWGFGQKRIFGPEVVREVRATLEEVEADEPWSDLLEDRVVRALMKGGYVTPGAVSRATDGELGAIGGIGQTTLRLIREVYPHQGG